MEKSKAMKRIKKMSKRSLEGSFTLKQKKPSLLSFKKTTKSTVHQYNSSSLKVLKIVSSKLKVLLYKIVVNTWRLSNSPGKEGTKVLK